jgi:hypothetical protein
MSSENAKSTTLANRIISLVEDLGAEGMFEKLWPEVDTYYERNWSDTVAEIRENITPDQF